MEVSPEALSGIARFMGAHPNEITKVEKTDAGVEITMFDGSVYVAVDEGGPEPTLMYRYPPIDGYSGTFPVYPGGGASPLVGDAAPPAVQSALAQAQNADAAAKDAAAGEATRAAAKAAADASKATAAPAAAPSTPAEAQATAAAPSQGEPVPVKGKTDPAAPTT
jgi:hypothetical protein